MRFWEIVVWKMVSEKRKKKPHPPHPPHPHKKIRGRFAGVYWTDPTTGEYLVAAQTVPVSTPVTAPLIFTATSSDGSPPQTVTGPIGVVSSSDPTVTPTLSADGQACNLTTPASGTFTITWHDPAGNVADFSVTLTDQAPVITVTGAFGTFGTGTTP